MDGLDNHAAIQISIAEVLGHIARNNIDPKTAWLLLHGLQIAGRNLRYARPNAEAPIPETIIEDPPLGQLAAPEPGRNLPPNPLNQMRATLEKDPNADLDKLIEQQTNPDFPRLEVQT